MAHDKIDRRRFLETSAAVAAGSAALAAGGCRPAKPPVTGGRRAASSGPASTPLERFGVSEAQLRRVFARALQHGGDFCDLYFQSRRNAYLGLEDHAVNRAHTLSEQGVGIRVVRGTETGYAFTESLDLESMLQAAEVAASVAADPTKQPPRTLQVGRAPSYYAIDKPWPEVPTQRKVSVLHRLHDRIAAGDKRIAKINISYRDEDSHVLVVDSEGRMMHDHQPMAVCYASCVARQGSRRESNYAAMAGRRGMELFSTDRIERMASQLIERTTTLFDAVAGPVGELPVVLGPGSSGILLHEAIGHGMEADFARKKTTIYSDEVGKRIAPEFVTIVDDGTREHLRGSINFDDEGNLSQRTVLVEHGVLRTFLHDRISAHHFRVDPTGSGRRQSFRHRPMPRMRNTYMLAGPHEREEIIRSVKRGIYADHFTNGQVKIGPGDFSFYVKNGMLIEDGKLTQPIKDVNIIGNGPQVLRDVTMVGNDFKLDDGGWTCGKNGQRVPVGLGMPTVAVKAITVGGTKQG